MPQDPIPHTSAFHQHPNPLSPPSHRSEIPFTNSPISSHHPLPGVPPSAINKIKNAPIGGKDTIPIGRTPRKQRSSRYYVTEGGDLERLPRLNGMLSSSFSAL